MGKAASSAASCSPLSRFATGDALITAMNDPTVLVSPSVMFSRRRKLSSVRRKRSSVCCVRLAKSSAADESGAIGEAVSAGASDSGASPWIAGARPSAASSAMTMRREANAKNCGCAEYRTQRPS